ncbi:GNAT family N-acetyltransferase [Clostridium paraputrificum]|uniref:GNAT family N-acetyltransferase n=1 Tax=Clostridium paraputrificum TaxID=29363 RepID=UPI003D3316EA
MVKNYVSLDNNEKKLVYKFITRREEEKKTIMEIEKDIKIDTYNYGKGVLFYFEDGGVLGKVSVVLEVAEVMHVAYIHNIDILEGIDNKEKVLKELIEKGSLIAKEYSATKILLGIRNNEVLKVAEAIELYSEYSSFIMILEERKSKAEILDIVPISAEILNEYVDNYNSSFMDMPHGTYIDLKEAKGYLEKVDENNEFFLVKADGITIGFMNVSIENNEGFFDIGLRKEYRKQGYGKMLLETAIDFLKKKDTEKICLIVIEKNSVAYEMYKKRGFKVYSKISNWIQIE